MRTANCSYGRGTCALQTDQAFFRRQDVIYNKRADRVLHSLQKSLCGKAGFLATAGSPAKS